MQSPTARYGTVLGLLLVWSGFPWTGWRACAAVPVSRPARGSAPAEGQEPAAAKLQDLKVSPSLLKAPAGVAGDFTVAREAPAIEFGFLPGQWEGAKLWSAWGDAVFASDGKFYAAIGDHADPGGHTYVYQIDPGGKTIKLVVDVNKVLAVPEGKYTPGKIHAPVVEGGDGWLYFATYRGGAKSTTEEMGFTGDWLLRYEPASGKTENLGILVPNCSIPSMVCHAPSETLYGLAVPGKTLADTDGRFFAYDIKARKLIFVGGPPSSLSRSVMLLGDGSVYYESSGKLVRYDPKEKKVAVTEIPVPGNRELRASSRAGADGVAYGISRDGLVFSFDPAKGKVAELQQTFVTGRLYTAVCRLDPTDKYLYYVPSAHGGSVQHGTAVVQMDVKTQKRKVLAFLNETVRQQMDYNLGGTFSIALSKEGDRLFFVWNGGPPVAKKNDFGRCAAMILHIPASERQ